MSRTRAVARDYRFAIRFSPRAAGAQNMQARLASGIGVDPQSRLRCGTFTASDGAAVPYRLWLARQPRAAVLLLHGAFDYSAAFDEIGPKFARRGFAALAFDQRGFGATESRGAWAGAQRMADDVVDAAAFLLDRIQARIQADAQLFILGESMGGAVAIHAAARANPPRLHGLVLAAPGALASRLRHRMLGWLAAIARAVAGDAELVFERLSGWELTPAAAIRLIGDPLVMRRIRPEVMCGMADLALSSVNEARKVGVPVLTMVGARDELVRLTCIRRLFDNLGGEKTWLAIEDAPHLLLHWRRSGEIVREAAAWIAARTAGAASCHDGRNRSLPLAPDHCRAGAGLG